ncbi:hypothetical protein E2K93_08050 [Thalassotalea sp. HSM 43]|uniref:PH domain-containing protein n=1 Tax=Thalassotalea sp. HSM 43 TaxID=2552945 RepID=UPI0010819A1B|nr:PH domain-containing protein [Thalassotalea sp. HSM 43]QBY04346.1 hypothetical protein E2K93_08050 [Thalassotalea sp. HSM 43]
MANNSVAWQRISPIAIIYFILMLIKNLVGNVVYILPGLLVLYNQVEKNPGFWWPFIYAMLALLLISAILSFYFFQYRLSNQQIEIRSGVLSRKYIDLPFAKIQNVELSEPFYYRPFGYTCIQFDTAGSARQEAKVVAIKKDFALQLKQEILAIHNSANAEVAADDDSESIAAEPTEHHNEADETVLDRRNLDDLVIHGLTNNRVWILLAGIAPFMEQVIDKLISWSMYWGINLEQYFDFAEKSIWQIIGTFLSIFLTIMLVVSLLSIIGSIIMFHNFKLSRYEDKYIRRSGLFTRTEVTMRLSRLQKIVWQQDWLDVLLRRINLRFEQSNANIANVQPGQISNKIIVPSVTHKECHHLIDDAYPDADLKNVRFNRVSIRLFVRNILLFVLPVSAIISYLAISHNDYQALAPIGAATAFVSFLFYMRYRRWGWANDGKYLYIRKGCLGVNYYIFESYKVQQTEFIQSWFLKRRQLCSLQLVLASGSISVPYIPEQQGFEWLNNTLTTVESTRRNWM